MAIATQFIRSITTPILRPKSQPARFSTNPEELESLLSEEGLKISINKEFDHKDDHNTYYGTLENKPILIKLELPENLLSNSTNRDFSLNLEIEILSRLKDTAVIVPKLLYHFPEYSLIIIEDLRTEGYEPFEDVLISGRLSRELAHKLGLALDLFLYESSTWEDLDDHKTPDNFVYDRGLELRMLYPNTQLDYQRLAEEFLKANHQWTWSEVHPKNIMVKNNQVAFSEFGLSYKADPRYVAPSLLGQLIVYTLAGYVDKADGVDFIEDLVQVPGVLQGADENLSVRYAGMEILHRSFGRRINGIQNAVQKKESMLFGLKIFDYQVSSFEYLIRSLVDFNQ